jgi:acetyl-CoA carboxylase biotin carboxyl carrier protein
MEIKDLKTLIKMVTETDITEFEMENAEEKILIKRGSGQEVIHLQAPQQVYAQQAAPPLPVAAPGVAPTAAASASAVQNDKYETITSPIVGTFYRKPSPDADLFTKEGEIVEKGQTICLVEAMKLFNEIEAEFKCKIIEVLKDDATPVEFGDPLFLVEPL